MRRLPAALALAALAGCGSQAQGPVEVEARYARLHSSDKMADLEYRIPRLGFTRGQIRKMFGDPDAEPMKFRTTSGKPAELWVYFHSRPKYTFEFIDGLVSRIWDHSIRRAYKEL